MEPDLSLNEYQQQAIQFAAYDSSDYPFFALCVVNCLEK